MKWQIENQFSHNNLNRWSMVNNQQAKQKQLHYQQYDNLLALLLHLLSLLLLPVPQFAKDHLRARYLACKSRLANVK